MKNIVVRWSAVDVGVLGLRRIDLVVGLLAEREPLFRAAGPGRRRLPGLATHTPSKFNFYVKKFKKQKRWKNRKRCYIVGISTSSGYFFMTSTRPNPQLKLYRLTL